MYSVQKTGGYLIGPCQLQQSQARMADISRHMSHANWARCLNIPPPSMAWWAPGRVPKGFTLHNPSMIYISTFTWCFTLGRDVDLPYSKFLKKPDTLNNCTDFSILNRSKNLWRHQYHLLIFYYCFPCSTGYNKLRHQEKQPVLWV